MHHCFLAVNTHFSKSNIFFVFPQYYQDTEARTQPLEYVISCFCNHAAIFHDAKLPFHLSCQVKATLSVSKQLLDSYPNAVKQLTENNNGTALHCFLLSWRPLGKQRNQENCYIPVEKKVDTLSVQNSNGWYPINIANLPIDIISYMAKQAPITIVTEEQMHWNRQK